MRRVYIENLGCSKNQVDAEVMLAQLSSGFVRTEDATEADLIIVNTCGFIESAREESISVNCVPTSRRESSSAAAWLNATARHSGGAC